MLYINSKFEAPAKCDLKKLKARCHLPASSTHLLARNSKFQLSTELSRAFKLVAPCRRRPPQCYSSPHQESRRLAPCPPTPHTRCPLAFDAVLPKADGPLPGMAFLTGVHGHVVAQAVGRQLSLPHLRQKAQGVGP